jgi:endogenous inhibitor of DNA gyrase (YacG/DUF329 family)
VPFRPFCGERCKLIDLHRWLNEEYRISEEHPELEAGEDDPSDGQPEGPADAGP